jgi:hypothetical protein
MLRNISVDLCDLKRLTLWGCGHVTRAGLDSVIREAEWLEELSIDASPQSVRIERLILLSLGSFSTRLTYQGIHDLSSCAPLNFLHTLSISFSSPHLSLSHPTFLSSDLPNLPSLPALTSLFLNLSSDLAILPPDAIDHLAAQIAFSRLTRLSILHLFCTSDHVNTILALCPDLEELYITVISANVLHETTFGQHGAGEKLTVVHVTGEEPHLPTVEDLRMVAARLPGLEQVGMGNRVYEVHRSLQGAGEEAELVIELSRWSRIYTPSYFLNWRG